MVKETRLCTKCSVGPKWRASPKLYSGIESLRCDVPCVSCGVIAWTMPYRRLKTHPWLLFWTWFFVGIGLYTALYFVFLLSQWAMTELPAKPAPIWFKTRPKELF